MTGRGVEAYSADDIAAAIASAIRDRELEAVPGLIALLALRDPRRAEVVLECIKAVLDLAKTPDCA